MAVADVFVGKSRRRQKNEDRRRQAIEDLMALDPREKDELPHHAEADARRLTFLMASIEEVRDAVSENSRSTHIWFLALFIVLLIRGVIPPEWITHLFGFQ